MSFLTALFLTQYVEHLLGVHPTEPLIPQAKDFARFLVTRHRQQGLVGVHVSQLDVDDVVTRGVGQVMVYVMQPFPCCQMPIALVHVLVHHKEGQLLVSQLVHERPPVCGVTPVGPRSPHLVVHTGLTHHEQTHERLVVLVSHQRYMHQLKPLFSSQLLHTFPFDSKRNPSPSSVRTNRPCPRPNASRK